MLSLTPSPIKLLDFYDDGEKTRHYSFQLQDNTVISNWSKASPGQFFMLNLPDIGEAAFTFTNPPGKDGIFRALIRQMGELTSALMQLQPGTILGARGPFGRGWPVNQLENKSVLIIAGGCGLAPLVNLIDTLIDKNNKQVVLVYGARNRNMQMLSPERQRWKNNISVIEVIDEGENSNDLPVGTPFDVLPIALKKLETKPDKVLLCGPEVMMFALARHFSQEGIPDDSIYLSMERRMHCAVGLCGHCYMKDKYACTDGPTFSWQEMTRLGNRE